MSKTICEPAKQIPVVDEADVIVVGSGPAGHSAALAASRAGAKKVILVERFNHMGGMPTGGFVLYVPSIGNPMNREYRIYGIQKEWKDRLSAYEHGLLTATPEEIGSKDPEVQKRWKAYVGFIAQGDIDNCFYVDPDMFKIVLDQMIADEGGRIVPYLECWGVAAIVEDGTIKGVIIESKEGRKALLGKIVIDATGDGDIAAFAGCDFESDWDPRSRSSKIAVCSRIGGIDFDKFMKYKASLDKEGLDALNKDCHRFNDMYCPLPTNRNEYAWVNSSYAGSCINIRDLNDANRETRRDLPAFIENLHKYPGLENAYLVDLAPQTGTRGSRRIKCRHTMTEEEWANPVHHEDVVLVTGPYTMKTENPVWIPYRCLTPLQCENLIVAGRCYSSTSRANDSANVIPHCIVLGQAAGIAAAIAIEDETQSSKISISKLHAYMRAQDMFLPDEVV